MDKISTRSPIEALQQYLRGCDQNQKIRTAELAGTSVNNLHQIAGGHTGCSPTMAVMLETATMIVARGTSANAGRWVHRNNLTEWFKDNRELLEELEKRTGTKLRLFVA